MNYFFSYFVSFILQALKPDKRKRDEISRGRRKRRREDTIQTEKQEHSPTVSRRIQYPDKFQKISQMVFRNRVPEIHPIGDKVLSSPRVQHQGGGCSALEEWVQDIYMPRRLKLKPNPKS